jgi:integrase
MIKQITLHDLRHTFASNYMMNGGEIFKLQKMLGNTDIKMTMRYAHLSPEHLYESVEFMDMVNGKKEKIPDLDLRETSEKENLLMLGS